MTPLLTKIWNKLKSLRVTDRRHLYKYCERDHLKRLLQHYQIDCVFDVGANDGQYATMLRKDVGFKGLIFSFEPNPAAAEHAMRQAQHDARWHVEQMAISVSDGVQSFNVMADSQFSSLSAPRHDESDLFRDWNKVNQTIEVKTETLTTAYRRLQALHGFNRPFLKMDTQGYDVEIVTHAGPALAEFLGLQSELAVKKLYENSVDFKKAIEVYESCGFELSAFVPNNGGHFPHLVETDCIMIRKDAPRG
jgi:FkbM family methyltransferase